MIDSEYIENEEQRRIKFSSPDQEVVLVKDKSGYGMVNVIYRDEVVEKYYGLDMAVDHAAEILGVSISEISVPSEAQDMGI